MRNPGKIILSIFMMLILLVATMATAGTGHVKGWIKAGNDPQGYVVGTAKEDGGSVAFIKSVDPEPNRFGTLVQSFSAQDYKGKRVRLTAMIRTVDVENWVGMWLRGDADRKSVAFDNMQDRSLDGTTEWQEYSIVLDIPEACDNMAMGLILQGPGEAYWRGLKLEEVGLDVPVTGYNVPSSRTEPKNLNFED